MLVLDEPSEGLDPVGIEILLQLLKDLAAEGGLFPFLRTKLRTSNRLPIMFSSSIAVIVGWLQPGPFEERVPAIGN